MRQGRIPHQETIKRLLAVRETCSSWAQVTARLGYLPRMAATLQKVLTGAPGAISARAERDLRVRLGLPEGVVPVTVTHAIGSGTLVMLGDAETMAKYVTSEAFMRRLTACGGVRRVVPRSPGLVATLHQGGDGRLFVYVLNGGKGASVQFRLAGMRPRNEAVAVRDILNGGPARALAFAAGSEAMELPLAPGAAALLELGDAVLVPERERAGRAL